MYEIFELLLEKSGITAYRFCKDTNTSQSTIYTWKKKRSLASAELAKIVCDYFGVSLDYLMTGQESPDQKPGILSTKEERDIARDLNSIMEKLNSGENGPATFDGRELSPEAADLFRDQLELMLRNLKIINKEKYNPVKNKK